MFLAIVAVYPFSRFSSLFALFVPFSTSPTEKKAIIHLRSSHETNHKPQNSRRTTIDMSEVDGFKSKKRYKKSSEKDNHCAIALESKGDTPTTKDTVTPQNVQQHASEMMREYIQPELFPESSLECPLCLELLYDPVTLPCGHVFCKFCLERSMKEKAICPMCRENISYLNLKELRANPTMVSNGEQFIIFFKKN